MKTILFSLATTETAGPSAEVRVPTRKSTLSLRISSRAWRTASLASALESRVMSSSLRPSTPPLALISSMNIMAPLEAGSPKRAAGPESGIGMPTLMGFWASAASGMTSTAASNRISDVRRCIESSLSEHRQAGDGATDAIERGGRRDEERAVVLVAPREVRRVFRHLEHFEEPAVGIEHVDATRPAAIDVAGRVDLHAVRRAGLVTLGLGPHAAVRQRARWRDVEDSDVLARGVVDEQPPLVAGKAEPVGALEVVHEQLRRLRVPAHPVDTLEVQLLRSLDAVELGASVRRVGEVDAPIGLADDVVRAVELLASVVRGDRNDAAVALGP